MIFKGTDIDAFNKASIGRTKGERRKLYYENKNKNEQVKKRKSSSKKSVNKGCMHVNQEKNRNAQKNQTVWKKVAPNHKKNKYVPKRLILDDIRDFRSSRIISNISNRLATILMKLGRTNAMSNNQMNVLRSTIAFITSETLNKAFEKPLKIVDNIKMFIKVGKLVYKVILRYNETLNVYFVDEKRVKTIKENSHQYKSFLKKMSINKKCKNNDSVSCLLGKKVYIIVDNPIGSIHPIYNEITYPVNCGYLLNMNTLNSKRCDAYILGIEEPLSDFSGIVIAIISRKNSSEEKLVVCPKGVAFTKEQIREQVLFQEKYFDFDIKMN